MKIVGGASSPYNLNYTLPLVTYLYSAVEQETHYGVEHIIEIIVQCPALPAELGLGTMITNGGVCFPPGRRSTTRFVGGAFTTAQEIPILFTMERMVNAHATHGSERSTGIFTCISHTDLRPPHRI